MLIPPRSRWFQFSLGTLFAAVTLFAVWLGWELQFIHERQAWLRENSALINLPINKRESSIPFWRVWLGDSAVSTISYPPYHPRQEGDADRARAGSLFPEAELMTNVDAAIHNAEIEGRKRTARSIERE